MTTYLSRKLRAVIKLVWEKGPFSTLRLLGWKVEQVDTILLSSSEEDSQHWMKSVPLSISYRVMLGARCDQDEMVISSFGKFDYRFI